MSKDYKTIGIKNETKEELDMFLEYFGPKIAKIIKKPLRKLTYDDVIKFLLKNVKVNPEIISKMRELEVEAQAY